MVGKDSDLVTWDKIAGREKKSACSRRRSERSELQRSAGEGSEEKTSLRKKEEESGRGGGHLYQALARFALANVKLDGESRCGAVKHGCMRRDAGARPVCD